MIKTLFNQKRWPTSACEQHSHHPRGTRGWQPICTPGGRPGTPLPKGDCPHTVQMEWTPAARGKGKGHTQWRVRRGPGQPQRPRKDQWKGLVGNARGEDPSGPLEFRKAQPPDRRVDTDSGRPKRICLQWCLGLDCVPEGALSPTHVHATPSSMQLLFFYSCRADPSPWDSCLHNPHATPIRLSRQCSASTERWVWQLQIDG